MNDHYNDPPYDTVEPPRYQSWRWNLSNNHSLALSTANTSDNDSLKFWSNTELRILSLLKRTRTLEDEEVVFGWDLDGGVWILDPSPTDNDRSVYIQSLRKLHTLLQREFVHWNQALAECGAVYYKNCISFHFISSLPFFALKHMLTSQMKIGRDSLYSRAAVAAHAEPWGYSRPYFMTKYEIELALQKSGESIDYRNRDRSRM